MKPIIPLMTLPSISLPGEPETAPLFEVFIEVEGDSRDIEEKVKRFSNSLYLTYRYGKINIATRPHTFRALRSRITEEVLLELQEVCKTHKEANMNLIFHNLDARKQSLFLAYFNTQGIKNVTGRDAMLPPHKAAGENLLVMDGVFRSTLDYEEFWTYIEFLVALSEYFLVCSMSGISHIDFAWWVEHKCEVHIFPHLLFRLSQ
jgi:hypothetical protein